MAEEDQTDIDRTEPQRRALEEMSQALLDKLNDMVSQQEARAQEFAERVHSLSPLPQAPEVGLRGPAEPVTEVRTEENPARAAVKVPPLVQKVKQVVEELPPHRRQDRATQSAAPSRPKKEEGSMNVGLLVLIGAVLFILLRSCS